MTLPAVLETTHRAGVAALTVVVVLDPTAPLRSAPDHAGWLRGQQRLDRVMSRVAPPLFLLTAGATAAAAVVALVDGRAGAAAARTVTAACVVAAVRVTLTRSEPENARIRGWRPEDPPAADWREVRDRWEAAHRSRRALLAVAALATAAGVAVDASGRR
ncbi:anthrone oxygenase family protein [Microlunatus capsulatus]|uniref:DUF1772 domain-containing protein n=2 Tax=Microlunatus capsulatus TaxID=99117 RepID=A0ABS4ZDK5_9ACTN|nr:anthrone oxygenase family protein [Microlunatus capsulatus]MBP2419076.1 hypothetical protein [Microlunatus capsulatus]